MKRILAVLTALILNFGILNCVPVQNMGNTVITAMAAETVESGTCGENLVWTLDDKGTLVVSGTGKMQVSFGTNYKIKKVIIQEGATSIDTDAFFGCENLTDITIPASVTSIGTRAFGYYPYFSLGLGGMLLVYKINVTVHGYSDTIAEEYAKENNFEFVVLEDAPTAPETIKGDVNADGEFTIADVAMLQKWLLDAPDLSIPDLEAVDFCEDGEINVFDLCIMKQEIVNQK